MLPFTMSPNTMLTAPAHFYFTKKLLFLRVALKFLQILFLEWNNANKSRNKTESVFSLKNYLFSAQRLILMNITDTEQHIV